MEQRQELPEGWHDLGRQVAWIRERLMTNDPSFVMGRWDCKYVNLRIDMRTGAAILSPGNT